LNIIEFLVFNLRILSQDVCERSESDLKILNSKHLPARSRFGEGRRNPKQTRMFKKNKLSKQKNLGFRYLNFEFARPVKLALATSGLMYHDPSEKSKVIDFGRNYLTG